MVSAVNYSTLPCRIKVTHPWVRMFKKEKKTLFMKTGSGSDLTQRLDWVGQNVHSGFSVTSYGRNPGELFGQPNSFLTVA